MNFKKQVLLLTVLLAFVVLTLSGCGEGEVVARVNGEKITLSELNKKVEEIKAGLESQGIDIESEEGQSAMGKVEEEALNQLINETLLLQEAEKQGVLAGDDEVQRRLREIKKNFSSEEFESLLKAQNLTERDFKKQLKLQLSADALFNKVTKDVKVSDGELREYFEKNRKDLEQIKVAHILISVDPDASKSEEEKARNKAVEIINKLHNGADFSSLARTYSEDSQTKENGGVIDIYFTREDPFFMEEFIEGAFKLKEGEFSKEPVRTTYGYHIIKVIDSRTSYEELKSTIRDRLLSEKKNDVFVKYFNKIKKDAKIENMLKK
ncbi:MAG TPA: hypothetical protein DEA47_04915 [Peptococcaceae bacterium]|nr:MAG: PpiC-type peptidyl-prolyl cis-trans isomerase [Clostridia bacterium 41_269]HBT20683.1 hypothetical protein [Peptococcaceae bacterium]